MGRVAPPEQVPFPSPDNADARNLQPLYEKVHAAVRAVDDDVLVFFAGVTWDDLGFGFTAPPGGAAYANRSVVAYHYYKPPQISVPFQFTVYQLAARRLKTAAFMTESDHAPGREVAVGDVGDGADAALQSWATWEWKNFYRGADSAVSQFAEWGAAKTGAGHVWPGLQPSLDFQTGYARTYAPAIAGEAESMYFNVTSGDFKLVYTTTATTANGESSMPTEVYVWPERYPGGAAVVARASSGTMRIQYDGKGSQVLIYPGADVAPRTRVTVTVGRKSQSQVVG